MQVGARLAGHGVHLDADGVVRPGLDGVADLVEESLDIVFSQMPPSDEEESKSRGIRIAIVGRPNVGKSTLVNTLLGEERVIAFDMPGTTRDSIEIPFERDGQHYVLIDTAGRLQNRQDLMEELSKIVRVIRKKDPTAPHNTLLVLDATTGQNAINQVEIFRKIADVSGLVMTKLDGTAKGGVLVALADKFGLPIHAIGVGEQIDDLAPFDPEDFAKALVGQAD